MSVTKYGGFTSPDIQNMPDPADWQYLGDESGNFWSNRTSGQRADPTTADALNQSLGYWRSVLPRTSNNGLFSLSDIGSSLGGLLSSGGGMLAGGFLGANLLGALSGAGGSSGIGGGTAEGLSAADTAGGLVPQYGTNAAYDAGISGAGAGTGAASTAADAWNFAPSGGGADQIGSDWATGNLTGAPGGALPTTPGGSTTANTQAGSGLFSGGVNANPLQSYLPGYGNPSGVGGSTQGGGALARILAGNGTGADIASVLGNLGTGLVDAYGANKQADTLRDLSDKYLAIGAPSRDRYNASFAPGFTMANDPGYTDALNQTSKGILHGLSVQGNPADSPNAWAQSLSDLNAKFAYPALQDYRNTNANTGGFGAFNAAAPGAAQTAAGAQSNIYNVAGKTLSNITNPTTNYADLLRQLTGNYSNIFGG